MAPIPAVITAETISCLVLSHGCWLSRFAACRRMANWSPLRSLKIQLSFWFLNAIMHVFIGFATVSTLLRKLKALNIAMPL